MLTDAVSQYMHTNPAMMADWFSSCAGQIFQKPCFLVQILRPHRFDLVHTYEIRPTSKIGHFTRKWPIVNFPPTREHDSPTMQRLHPPPEVHVDFYSHPVWSWGGTNARPLTKGETFSTNGHFFCCNTNLIGVIGLFVLYVIGRQRRQWMPSRPPLSPADEQDFDTHRG